MTPKLVCALFILLTVRDACSLPSEKLDLGYERLFMSNTDELEQIVMNFTQKKVPSWLTGSLVRVGPGQFEIESGASSSHVRNALDGFAKLAQWSFLGNNSVLFSTKFINSTYRTESLAKNRFTSNVFVAPPYPDLDSEDVQRGNEIGLDNMDISIVDLPNSETNAVSYVATNDILSVYEVTLDNLNTVRKVLPDISGASTSSDEDSPKYLKRLSTSHPLPEPNTESNLINVLLEVALTPDQKNWMKVVRIKSLTQTEVVASWEIPEVPFLHSFSVTQRKVIILINPYILNVEQTINTSALNYTWKYEDDPTTVYIADLQTGNVQNVKINKTFVFHHVNAYEVTENHLVAHVAAYDSPIAITKMEMEKSKDAKSRREMDTRADLRRIDIFLDTNTATIDSVASPTPVSSIASTLEYPVINEANRSKPYCFVYGIVEKVESPSIASMGVVKKDLCTDDGRQADAIYQEENYYPSEPTFVPTPGATAEDDGILLVPYTSGDQELTHLIILNATDLSYIDMAEGPIPIPLSQHGKYFSRSN